MKILAIDSCSSVATGALLFDNILASEFVINDKNTHSVKLLPQIENMLKSVNASYSELDYFACTIGPGSFTGQRIGVSTLKALAHVNNKPCVGISSLEALAYNAINFSGYICPVMDARRNQTYTGLYKSENGKITCEIKDFATSIEELLEMLKNKGNVIFLGDGVLSFRDIIIEKLGSNAVFPPEHLLFLRGSSVAVCAKEKIKNNEITTYQKLLPSYLRLSQAEREYNEKHKINKVEKGDF